MVDSENVKLHMHCDWLLLTYVKLLIIINQLLIYGTNKAVFCLEVVIYKRLQIWRHNYVISRNAYVILHSQNLTFLRYIHCNFCLNLHITRGDIKENVSGCFFLNTVYIVNHQSSRWNTAYNTNYAWQWTRAYRGCQEEPRSEWHLTFL